MLSHGELGVVGGNAEVGVEVTVVVHVAEGDDLDGTAGVRVAAVAEGQQTRALGDVLETGAGVHEPPVVEQVRAANAVGPEVVERRTAATDDQIGATVPVDVGDVETHALDTPEPPSIRRFPEGARARDEAGPGGAHRFGQRHFAARDAADLLVTAHGPGLTAVAEAVLGAAHGPVAADHVRAERVVATAHEG